MPPPSLAVLCVGLWASVGTPTIGVPAAALAHSVAPDVPEPPRKDTSAQDEAVVRQADEAWQDGKWPEVRRLLEPVVADRGRLGNPLLRDKALSLLADATLADETLDAAARRRTAASYLTRLIDADPEWRLQPGIYSPELFDLYTELQNERAGGIDEACQAELSGCRADRVNAKEEYEILEKKYLAKDVVVHQRVVRSRFLAFVPFGVGHFYNSTGVTGRRRRLNLALGGTFVTVEALSGIAGITLALYRVVADGCRRSAGFREGSLVCEQDAAGGKDGVVARRKAEESMAWTFLATAVLDIIIAQALFKPVEEVRVYTTTQGELDREGGAAPTPTRRPRSKPRAKVRPVGSFAPDGGSVGVIVRF